MKSILKITILGAAGFLMGCGNSALSTKASDPDTANQLSQQSTPSLAPNTDRIEYVKQAAGNSPASPIDTYSLNFNIYLENNSVKGVLESADCKASQPIDLADYLQLEKLVQSAKWEISKGPAISDSPTEFVRLYPVQQLAPISPNVSADAYYLIAPDQGQKKLAVEDVKLIREKLQSLIDVVKQKSGCAPIVKSNLFGVIYRELNSQTTSTISVVFHGSTASIVGSRRYVKQNYTCVQQIDREVSAADLRDAADLITIGQPIAVCAAMYTPYSSSFTLVDGQGNAVTGGVGCWNALQAQNTQKFLSVLNSLIANISPICEPVSVSPIAQLN